MRTVTGPKTAGPGGPDPRAPAKHSTDCSSLTLLPLCLGQNRGLGQRAEPAHHPHASTGLQGD